jgi:hypothetical protein
MNAKAKQVRFVAANSSSLIIKSYIMRFLSSCKIPPLLRSRRRMEI